MEDQQPLALLLLLAGLGAVLIVMTGRQAGAVIPSPAVGAAGARPQAVPYYQNEERWELRRDERGMLTEIVVHRDARVAG